MKLSRVILDSDSARWLSDVLFFVTLWIVACQSPLSMGFSKQEYQSGLPVLPQGDLPNPRIESESLVSCIGRHILYHCTTWLDTNI